MNQAGEAELQKKLELRKRSWAMCDDAYHLHPEPAWGTPSVQL